MINLLQTTTAPADTAAVSMAEKINGTIEALSNASVKEIIAGLSESIIGFGLKVLAAFAIYIVGTWVIRKLKNIVSKIFIKRKIDKAISSFVISLMSITLLVILIIAIIGILGIDTTSFAALLAAGGLAIGMALSGTVQNFAGGVMILLFKPFKIGDFIEAQGYMGTVSDISIANTQLSTIDNKIVIIPNGVLSNGTMTNFSSNKLRKVEWLVDVEYGSSSKLVKSVLTDIISADSRILNMLQMLLLL